jgi:hypothetical protein
VNADDELLAVSFAGTAAAALICSLTEAVGGVTGASPPPSPPQPAMANATSAAEPHRVNEIITFSPFYPDEPGAPAETRNMPVVESQSLPVCTWPSFHTGW